MFFQNLVQMGGFELNHHWHGINMLSLLECALLAACLCTMLALFFRFVRKSKRLTALSLVGALSFATAAYAANTALSALSASGALAGANLIYVVQTVGVGGVKATMTQVATFINSLFSGDFTVTSGGVATLKNTGPGATGPLGSTTTAPVVTIDAQGRVTALTSASIAFPAAPAGANPSATAGPTAINGAASTFMRSDGAPAIQQGSASQKGILQVDGTTITASSGVISAVGGSGTVTSIATACGVTGGTITTTGTISSAAAQRNATGTTDTITSTDCGNVVTESNASPVAVAITTAGFASGNYFTIKNKGAGLATYTPSSGTINGAGTIACAQNQSADLVFDGTNYLALGNTCQLGALATLTPGTGVAAQLANAVSTAGGSTQTIALGTAALGTSAISAGTCATVVTVSAANVATTDVITTGFNGDPTATTCYLPTAMLTIVPYPTSGNANFKVCNLTSSSITPSAVTINFRVVR